MIIIMWRQLDSTQTDVVVNKHPIWDLSMTPEQVKRFLASTHLIQRRDFRIRSDEFTMYTYLISSYIIVSGNLGEGLP